jgi:hypothetical protein
MTIEYSIISRDKIGFPNIKKDIGYLEGGMIILDIDIDIGYYY